MDPSKPSPLVSHWEPPLNMEATAQIRAILEEWRQLTQSKADALRAESWQNVAQFQSEKLALQSLLTPIIGKWAEKHSNQSEAGVAMTREFKDLMDLENRNAQILHEKMQAARAMQTSLQQTTLNLRRVHQSVLDAAGTGLAFLFVNIGFFVEFRNRRA